MREALEMALDALEIYGAQAPAVRQTIAAARKALAQPEQEPVAYCYVQKGTSVDILTFDDAPDDAVDGTIFPLYTTPPKRPWVGLTDADVFAVIKKIQDLYHRPPIAIFAQAIEATLKEKNT